jgi:hypothetical protein
MKLTTITIPAVIIPAVELTHEEHFALWAAYIHGTAEVNGARVTDWNRDDGHNSVLLEGEWRYRTIIVVNERDKEN